MSTTTAPPAEPAPGTIPAPETGAAPATLPPEFRLWRWAITAIIILSCAIGVRYWQEARFAREESKGIEVLPFELDALPTTVGVFQAHEGLDARLDPATVRYAGGLKHLVRTYTDPTTGVRLLVLVIYGRADAVIEHVPELCYGGAGYAAEGSGVNRTFHNSRDDNTPDVTFQVGRYRKPLPGGGYYRDEAYHAFRFREAWSPANPLTGHNRRPFGIFKIQVQRKLGELEGYPWTNSELNDEKTKHIPRGPIEEFLSEFVPAFEKLMAEVNEGARKDGAPK
jgi:hypothetical protein